MFILKHKFLVGQIVELAQSSLLVATVGAYEIREQLPLSEVKTDSPRYRVKSLGESFERVARESELTLSTATSL